MKTKSVESNFLAIEEKYSNFDCSDIVIVPCPYEHRVSYGGGTAQAPEAILRASSYVEFFDDETARQLCFDRGIATIESLDFSGRFDIDALELIENTIDELLSHSKFVVTLGGEHTISLAPIRLHFNRYRNMSILQFDAHSDFRDTYEGSKYSHASVMARVAEFFPAVQITQVGIRAQCIEEYDFIKANKVNTFYASAIRRGIHGANWQKSVVDTLTDEIYITLDVDYFDPAIMPATGTPEPDGFLYNETIEVIREIKRQNKRIVGLDVVELAPIKNLHHCDLTTARLIYKILNLQFS